MVRPDQGSPAGGQLGSGWQELLTAVGGGPQLLLSTLALYLRRMVRLLLSDSNV